MTEEKEGNRFKNYPKTEVFSVEDSTGDPHNYCISPKHTTYASDEHSGRLTSKVIDEYERLHGPSCGHPQCNLLRKEHKQILIIGVKSKVELKDVPGLQDYLLSIEEQAKADNVVGYRFAQLPDA